MQFEADFQKKEKSEQIKRGEAMNGLFQYNWQVRNEGFDWCFISHRRNSKRGVQAVWRAF
ncbi:hypothetical protein ABD67_02240 [Bacillus sonorensis]|nr:hypothetical protein [Bacillus sonorensis]